jgi:hypothetical protein
LGKKYSIKYYRAMGIVQVVKHLLSKHETRGSIPSIVKKQKQNPKTPNQK